jgi:peptidyl-prolyl cis-trans isomerase B (cyclophilin B)
MMPEFAAGEPTVNHRILSALGALLLIALARPALAADPRVLMSTSLGDVTLELHPDQAPRSVENFLRYVDEGYYDGTVFHRVIDGFMIQGGGFTADLERRDGTRNPIPNEADNGLKNRRGSLAMARTSQPHSATAQFFINLVDNSFLDHREKTRSGWGYAVFGDVVEGLEVVERIGKLTTATRPNGMGDVPIEPPVIRTIRRLP